MVSMPRRTTGAAVMVAMSMAWGLAVPAGAGQDEDALRAALEGKRVTVRIDMPGTSDGVDVEADSGRPLDFRQHEDRLRRFGTAIHAGESVAVTLVKVKKDLIEFHLAGGGFGVFGDDTSTTVYMPRVDKSKRERELEKIVENERDPRERRERERELDRLREERARVNRRIDAERAAAEARNAELVAERRRNGGSRFNLRYNDAVPSGIRPTEVMAALEAYVDFLVPEVRARIPEAEPSPAGDLMPRKGMTRAEAERTLGQPVTVSERREGSVTVVTLVFDRREQRITADFIEDVLVRYTVTSK